MGSVETLGRLVQESRREDTIFSGSFIHPFIPADFEPVVS